MKGSTLTFNIIDGEFDDNFFTDGFEPMIQIIKNDDEEIEHTKVITG